MGTYHQRHSSILPVEAKRTSLMKLYIKFLELTNKN